MITIKNNLNQSIAVGERELAAAGSMTVRSVDAEIERLARRGFITVVERAAQPPQVETDETTKKEKK